MTKCVTCSLRRRAAVVISMLTECSDAVSLSTISGQHTALLCILRRMMSHYCSIVSLSYQLPADKHSSSSNQIVRIKTDGYLQLSKVTFCHRLYGGDWILHNAHNKHGFSSSFSDSKCKHARELNLVADNKHTTSRVTNHLTKTSIWSSNKGEGETKLHHYGSECILTVQPGACRSFLASVCMDSITAVWDSGWGDSSLPSQGHEWNHLM